MFFRYPCWVFCSLCFVDTWTMGLGVVGFRLLICCSTSGSLPALNHPSCHQHKTPWLPRSQSHRPTPASHCPCKPGSAVGTWAAIYIKAWREVNGEARERVDATVFGGLARPRTLTGTKTNHLPKRWNLTIYFLISFQNVMNTTFIAEPPLTIERIVMNLAGDLLLLV